MRTIIMLYEKTLSQITSASIQTGFKATKSQRKAIDQALACIAKDDNRIEHIYNNDDGVVIIILKGNVNICIGKRGKINLK